MTDDIDVMRRTLLQYDKAVKLKRLNEELYDYLIGSVVWLLKYAEKYSIPLPQKQELYDSVKRAESMIDRILEENRKPIPSPRNQHPFTTPEDSTEPIILIDYFFSIHFFLLSHRSGWFICLLFFWSLIMQLRNFKCFTHYWKIFILTINNNKKRSFFNKNHLI